MTDRDDIILKLGANPELAHRALFEHRHPQESPPFHRTMIVDWHSPARFVLDMVFRGGAKSTVAEEAVVTMACFRKFRNCVILGASEDKAKERLKSIKHELENNEFIHQVFGDMVGETWAETKIITSNGIMIQAYGRGQALRGSKYLDQRPDLLLADDIEDEESVSSPENRQKMLKWWFSVVIPAMDPKHRVRMTATPLDEEALAVTLAREPGVVTHHYPILRANEDTGEEESTWPERFPTQDILAMRERYISAGAATEFEREYMVRPIADSDKQFLKEHFRSEAVPRKPWQATYAFYDPARTVNKNSSHTGKAVWSWVGNRLVVWRSGGYFWKPDEIINDIFTTDEQFSPIAIGVERDGLEEFILQPLRHQQVLRQHPVPIRPDKAPKGKDDFIKGLQPFFRAHEVTFSTAFGDDHAELQKQLLSFPTGRKDVPNALAYALKMRPGAPIHDAFNDDHVGAPAMAPREPLWLAVNSNGSCCSAVLCQWASGQLSVFADWLREGEPGIVLSEIVASAGLEAGRPARSVAPPTHFTDRDTIGMRAAARRIPMELRVGGEVMEGRETLRKLFASTAHGRASVVVDPNASWTLRALAGGFCRGVSKSGVITTEAEEGPYRVLMEGLESLVANMTAAMGLDANAQVNYAYTEDGRRYISALAPPRR